MTLQRAGGIAALICAATYVFGFVLMLSVLLPNGFGASDPDPAQILGFLADHRGLMTLWYLSIYVVNGIFLLVLAIALFDLFRPDIPGLAQVTLGFGTLWATLVIGAGMVANVGLADVLLLNQTDPDRAAEVWQMVNTIENGLGGGNEIVGGVWVLLLGVAGLLAGAVSKPLSILGIVIGVAGLSTVLPALSEPMGAVFGLGFIAWFAWVGVALLRRRTA
ncbi:MAG: DUF4386 family protein [Pseudomonadota bacterium]